VSLASLSTIPASDGSFRVELNAKWPERFQAVVGTTMSVRVICHQRDTAIVIPRKALERGARGWTVELKLAEGKTERRVVRCGRREADQVEILSGLEAGQIILVP
jgi:multidrug efflux pump subunit AcrA (membrane-fusion protein)